MQPPLPLDGAAFGQPGEAVQLLQTHIGWIYLVGAQAFKLKKQVKFDFLDFRTLEQRRWACDREITLNRRLCLDLYLGFQPVREAPDGRRWVDLPPYKEAAGAAPVIDWAVWMKRLPAERMLDRLLEENQVGVAQVEEMAQTLAQFYLRQRGQIPPDGWGGLGGLESVTANVEENLREGLALPAEVLSPAALALIAARARRFLSRKAEVFRQRARDGFVVDGHGDLRSENICLPQNAPPIFFDCIEFNDRFRICDSALDAAFLAMDLDSRGHDALSRAFLARYQAACDPALPPRLMDFYLGYRAFVKGKVAAWIAGDAAVPPEQRATAREQARQLFDLAVRYALKKEPLLLVFCGVSGSGKSTLAAGVARRLRCVHLATDLIRDEVVPRGLPPEVRYAPSNSARVYQLLLERAAALLAQGQTVALDGTFTRIETRAQAVAAARAASAVCLLVWADCPPEQIDAHIRQRQAEQTAFGSEACVEVSRRQRDGFHKPLLEEGLDAICRVETGGSREAAIASVWEQLMRALASVSTLAENQ
jgi:aminoglycoside phosphotransferase family enzyme/predicted kinase